MRVGPPGSLGSWSGQQITDGRIGEAGARGCTAFGVALKIAADRSQAALAAP
ncbi:hypothetical protein [Saccharothrix sp. ST-888]|uniref:hypothetical protein n=1 Tax=Saccharothrix sp. ST-888 TaxID=1427391 RepID=UPI000B18B20D|nr:hypothetical protein [Saccharothrix sp. ST-888]